MEVVNGVILEEDAEYGEQVSDQEKIENDIKEFLKHRRIEMQRQEFLGIKPPKVKSENIQAKKMKGNIGPSKKLTFDAGTTSQQKQLFSMMADEFDIEKVIPKDNQAKGDVVDQKSEGEFHLSINNDELNDYYALS